MARANFVRRTNSFVPVISTPVLEVPSSKIKSAAKAPIQFVALLQFLRKMESFDSRNLRNPFHARGKA
jgi:hypothetical protein